MNDRLTADIMARALRASGKRHSSVTGLTLPEKRKDSEQTDVFMVDSENPFGNTGCVILASGLGTRFSQDASVNKLTAEFLGKPLIEWILDSTEGLFARLVVVTRHENVARICNSRGIRVILHDLPYRSDTVRLGLEAMQGTDGCLFCQGDQPLLTRESIAVMLLCGANDREHFYRLSWKDNAASPVLFPCWAYPALMNLPDGKGGGWILRQYPERVKCVEASDPSELADIDTPEDLAKLERIIRENK